VLSDVSVEPAGVEVDVGVDALGPQRVCRQDLGLWRVRVAEADAGPSRSPSPRQALSSRTTRWLRHPRSVSRVASAPACGACSSNPHVREVGVPGCVESTIKQRRDLRGIVLEIADVERQSLFGDHSPNSAQICSTFGW